MKIEIYNDPHQLGKAAGIAAASLIRGAIEKKGSANIILATGTSQFETLNQLISESGINWGQVTMFHLDEYIGLPLTHPASFRKYLLDRFLSGIPALKAAYLINGEGDPKAECERLGALISGHLIDVALIGIGENGHLAFNDPPADFETTQPYIIVELDESCRKQQLGEGWFSSFEEVPGQAISMSVQQILQSEHIICSVPDERKALAIKNCFGNGISEWYPASILQQHASCTLYLDNFSSAYLSEKISA